MNHRRIRRTSTPHFPHAEPLTLRTLRADTFIRVVSRNKFAYKHTNEYVIFLVYIYAFLNSPCSREDDILGTKDGSRNATDASMAPRLALPIVLDSAFTNGQRESRK